MRKTSSDENLRKAYSNMSTWYSYIENTFLKKIRSKSIEMLEVKKGSNVLEIGIGTGFALVEFAKLIKDSGKVYGIDITPEMIEKSRKRIEKNNFSDIVKIAIGNAKKLAFKNKGFDYVYISNVIDLFSDSDIKKALKEIKRVLKQDGKLGIVSVAKKGYERSKILKIYEILHKIIPDYSSTPAYIEDLLEDSGFKIFKTKEMKIAKIFPMKIFIAKIDN